MRNVRKIAAVAVATCGILFAGIGGASAAPQDNGDNIPVLSNINEFNWDDSPLCGFQIKTEHSKQKASCPGVHQENPDHSPVYIFTLGS